MDIDNFQVLFSPCSHHVSKFVPSSKWNDHLLS